MVKIGMLIGDRYEVLEKIGTGGMSDVYKGKDHKLNRNVAIKVLKQEFSENANFVSKFRVEAQAAAGLMHPNIVNVYDVGQEDGIYYIVMELVEGITLKKYIEKKARLSFKEAVSIAIQVSMGIEAAHNNHIIHRDIKPQNIIISKEGKVKVTDFGIAKAATSNTITSNVMGSVHYTSPEQARGGYSDEKSDIYSLGITLFEMLTGRVPFNGETTVAIAIKHIQEPMPSPRDFVSEIPSSVEQIVYKCCQKSPDRRYQSMADLIKDLKNALMNPEGDFVKMDEEAGGETKVMGDPVGGRDYRDSRDRDSHDRDLRERDSRSRDSRDRDVRERDVRDRDLRNRDIREKDGRDGDYRDSRDQKVKRAASGRNNAQDRKQRRYIDEPYEENEQYEYEERESDSKMEKLTTILAIAAAVIIGLIVIFLVLKTVGLLDPSSEDADSDTEISAEQVQMIDVAGQDADAVKKALLEVGLTPVIEYEESSEYAQGKVIRCNVGSGEIIPAGSEVVLTVSLGETGVEVPDVVGLSEAEAVSTLVNKGFVPSKTEGYDDFIQAGCIYKQSPDGNTKAPAGTTISIYISKGPEVAKVSVPKLTGLDEVTAMAVLTENKLELGNVTEVNTEDPDMDGLVCNQSYAEGSFVDEGTKIDISISVGPELATYKFEDTITEPTASEDPNYRSGTLVTVTLMADDGAVLLSTQTASFPVPQQTITGITSPTGVVIYQYVNQTEGSTITNEDGTVTTVDGVTESKEIVRAVSFVAEQ